MTAKEKAAGVLDTPATADTKTSAASVSVSDEAGNFTRLQALAKRAGHALVKTPSGYMLCRWTYSRHCADLATAQTLLAQMGVRE